MRKLHMPPTYIQMSTATRIACLQKVLHAGCCPGNLHTAILVQTVAGQCFNRLQTLLANIRSKPVMVLCVSFHTNISSYNY